MVMTLGCSVVTAGCARQPEKPEAGSLPRIGLAVSDTMRAWCAEFVVDSTAPSLELGQQTTLVFTRSESSATTRARLGKPKEGQCPAAFPQPRWIDYRAYGVDLVDSIPFGTEAPIVALIVASDVSWTQGAQGVPRADLDRDGRLEEVRRCTADEGEHWTVWSTDPGGRRSRRWHEYYDWGGFTDPTCQPGENGRDEAAPSPP